MSLGKAFDKFFKRLDFAFEAFPEAIEEAAVGGVPGSIVMVCKNGDVTLTGRIKSLRINGKLIRVPGGVLEGK